MQTAKIFKSGNSQAVRLPVGFRFNTNEAVISKIGDAIILLPKKKDWEALLDSLGEFSKDFMEDRNQPEVQNRTEILS